MKNALVLLPGFALLFVLIGCGDTNNYNYYGPDGGDEDEMLEPPRPLPECGCPKVRLERGQNLDIDVNFSCAASVSGDLRVLFAPLCYREAGSLIVHQGSEGYLYIDSPPGELIYVSIDGDYAFPVDDDHPERIYFPEVEKAEGIKLVFSYPRQD